MKPDELFEEAVKNGRAWAKAQHAHAASCKKAPNECVRCVAAIRTFGEMPTQLLSRVLAE